MQILLWHTQSGPAAWGLLAVEDSQEEDDPRAHPLLPGGPGRTQLITIVLLAARHDSYLDYLHSLDALRCKSH